MTNGGRLTFDHLAAIMMVELPEERQQLVDRVFSESLSVRALREIVAGARDPEQETGRRGQRPKSVLGRIERIISRSGSLLKELASFEELAPDAVVEEEACADVGLTLCQRTHFRLWASTAMHFVKELERLTAARLGTTAGWKAPDATKP